MAIEYTLLLDSPREPRKTIQIAKLGDDFEHSKYGKFGIGAEDIAAWKRNLDNLPGRRALIDEDHSADRTPRRTEASGWITDVRLENGTPVADVEWTPKGQQAIEEGRYLFISPTFGNFTDEHGNVHENTLIGAALTNRPFLNMPSLCLASEERVSEAIDADPELRFYQRALDGDMGEEAQALVMLDVDQATRDRAVKAGHALPDGSYPIETRAQLHSAAVLAASKHGNWQAAQKLIRRRAKDLGVDISTLPGFAGEKPSDSRRTMETATDNLDLGKLRKALGLDKDADPLKILEAATSAAEDAAKLQKGLDKKPVKTLEQQAKDAGLLLLDAKDVRQLQAQAAAGEAAQQQLQTERFDRAFTAALDAHKVTPEQRDSFAHVYALDAEHALKMLDEAPAILPDKPFGQPVLELDQNADPAQIAAAGKHPDGFELNRRIQKHMLDNNIPQSQFPKVLEQYVNGEVML